jgi:dephospho-CoA kinase
MRIYAVVGGIAAGKSTVCRMLARHGGRIVDLDRMGHRVLRSGRVLRQLSERFGADIVGADGEIDRRVLGERVFGRPQQLRALNAIVHPEIGRRLRRRLRDLERDGATFVLIDAALFLDVDLGLDVDAVLAVTAPAAVRRERLQRRDALTAEGADARLSSQPRVGVWTRRADFRIDTRGSLRDLEERVEKVWRQMQRHRRRGRKRGGS